MRRYMVLTVLLTILTACKKAKPPYTETEHIPAVVALTSPLKNELCNSGTIVSPTESKVVFKWTTTEKAYSYSLIIKNQKRIDSIVVETTHTETEVILPTGASYSWRVIAFSSKKIKNSSSEFRQFYNSGPGVVSYAPFAAEALTPADGQKIAAINGRITLSWQAVDLDQNIESYDIYFGSASPLTMIQKDYKSTYLQNLEVFNTTTYFWKIITKDSDGNTSESNIYKFTTF